jgi:hypothetical protein
MKILSTLGQWVLTVTFVTALFVVFAFATHGCVEAQKPNPIETVTVTPTVWEYRVVTLDATTHDKNGQNALATNSIKPVEADMDELGKVGWELVSSYVETETSYPNFGGEKFVTGIQPNVRPMQVVLLYKRHVQ